jgi:glycosyltransferase involved in cell wall biosynthesis
MPFGAACCKEHWPLAPSPNGALKVIYYSLPGNDHIYLPEVVVHCADRLPHVQFICVGNNQLNVAKPNIECLGTVGPEEMKAIYRNSHCLLRYTRHDGFARSITEAMATGLDIITNQPIPNAHVVSDPDTAASVLNILSQRPRQRNIAVREWLFSRYSAESWANYWRNHLS